MISDIPEFGATAPGAVYALRPGGYAVIFNAAGEVAVVSTPCGFALPGGGQEGAESPEEAAVREAREECGLRIALSSRVGVADELAFAPDEMMYYRKRCTFFLAELVEELGGGKLDHELIWLAVETAVIRLRHGSQRSCRHRSQPPDSAARRSEMWN